MVWLRFSIVTNSNNNAHVTSYALWIFGTIYIVLARKLSICDVNCCEDFVFYYSYSDEIMYTRYESLVIILTQNYIISKWNLYYHQSDPITLIYLMQQNINQQTLCLSFSLKKCIELCNFYANRERAHLVWRHIKHYELTWGLLTTKWFICLFAEVLPIEVRFANAKVVYIIKTGFACETV